MTSLDEWETGFLILSVSAFAFSMIMLFSLCALDSQTLIRKRQRNLPWLLAFLILGHSTYTFVAAFWYEPFGSLRTLLFLTFQSVLLIVNLGRTLEIIRRVKKQRRLFKYILNTLLPATTPRSLCRSIEGGTQVKGEEEEEEERNEYGGHLDEFDTLTHPSIPATRSSPWIETPRRLALESKEMKNSKGSNESNTDRRSTFGLQFQQLKVSTVWHSLASTILFSVLLAITLTEDAYSGWALLALLIHLFSLASLFFLHPNAERPALVKYWCVSLVCMLVSHGVFLVTNGLSVFGTEESDSDQKLRYIVDNIVAIVLSFCVSATLVIRPYEICSCREGEEEEGEKEKEKEKEKDTIHQYERARKKRDSIERIDLVEEEEEEEEEIPYLERVDAAAACDDMPGLEPDTEDIRSELSEQQRQLGLSFEHIQQKRLTSTTSTTSMTSMASTQSSTSTTSMTIMLPTRGQMFDVDLDSGVLIDIASPSLVESTGSPSPLTMPKSPRSHKPPKSPRFTKTWKAVSRFGFQNETKSTSDLSTSDVVFLFQTRKFAKFLESEYSGENLLAWKVMLRYQAYVSEGFGLFQDPRFLLGVMKRAQYVYDAFLKPGAPCEANVSHSARRITVARLEQLKLVAFLSSSSYSLTSSQKEKVKQREQEQEQEKEEKKRGSEMKQHRRNTSMTQSLPGVPLSQKQNSLGTRVRSATTLVLHHHVVSENKRLNKGLTICVEEEEEVEEEDLEGLEACHSVSHSVSHSVQSRRPDIRVFQNVFEVPVQELFNLMRQDSLPRFRNQRK